LQPTPEPPEKVDYYGTSLFAPERAALLDLERMLGKVIPRRNHLEKEVLGFVEESGHVMKLGLGEEILSSLPESIGNLTSLQVLNFRAHRLKTLPESIWSLTSLTSLSFRGNGGELNCALEGIGRLTLLQTLDIASNRLPESIGNLHALQSLQLGSNIERHSSLRKEVIITSQRSLVFDKKTIKWADLFVHLDRLEFYEGEITSRVAYKEDTQFKISPSFPQHVDRKEEEDHSSINEYAEMLGIEPGYFKVGDDAFSKYDIEEDIFEDLTKINDIRKDDVNYLEGRSLIKLVTDDDKVYYFDTTILDYMIPFGSELLKEKEHSN
jgi:hypothetical protein